MGSHAGLVPSGMQPVRRGWPARTAATQPPHHGSLAQRAPLLARLAAPPMGRAAAWGAQEASRMSKLLQNFNVAGTALFFHILTASGGRGVATR